jgi:hypothetical protein
MPDSVLDPTVLVDSLVPLVDDLRSSLHPVLGTRPHTVEVVTRTWSGDRLGEGASNDVAVELSPPPRVRTNVRGELRPAGLEEEGDIVIDEISLTYTEAELAPAVSSPSEFFYRVTDAHGQGQRVREYVPRRPPEVLRGDPDIGWRIVCRRTENV